MNEFSTCMYINQQEFYQEIWEFGLKLLTKTEFELLNFQVVFNRGNECRQSKCLKFKYFTQESSEDEAKSNIEMAIGFLAYLVSFPLEDYGFIDKKANAQEREVGKNKSFKKYKIYH